MIPAPAIDTERLTLRAHRLEDVDDCTSMWADPVVTKHIGGRPFTAEETWTKVLRYAGLWSLLGFGYWVVRDRASGRFVGEVGFADFRRDIQPSLDGAPELGWALASWAHGRGLAAEAVRAALAWGRPRFASSAIVCLIDPANVPSIRVAQKCGFVERRRTSYKGASTIVYELERRSTR